MAQSLRELLASTPLSGGNAPFVEALYEQFLHDPQSVDAKWREYFLKLRNGSAGEQIHSAVQAGIAQRAMKPPSRARFRASSRSTPTAATSWPTSTRSACRSAPGRECSSSRTSD
jgi:2-oxoglutarate dehydrogenase complex dehydrogenase (E1) component-like enzyme